MFDHPSVEECESVGGKCEHLMRARWRPVWVKVSTQAPEGDQNRHLFSRGDWICPSCVTEYAAPRSEP